MSGLRRAGGLLLLAGFGLVVAGGLLEVGVLVLLGPQVRFPRHVVGADFGLRINEPGARYRHRSADVDVGFVINSRGLRADREFPYEKPSGRHRVLSLGDSFALGYEVESDEVFSSVLERQLRAAGIVVDVLNAGVSGYSNAEALLYFERELYRYQPDLVLLSFFGNDLVDNVRSGLFRLEAGELVEGSSGYVPGAGLGDFLNTNPFLNLLAEQSHAFAMLKERSNRLLKRRVVAENLRNLEFAEAEPHPNSVPPQDRSRAEEQLAGAILERLARSVRARGAALLIQSIPTRLRNPERLIEQFPSAALDLESPEWTFFPSLQVLEPWVDRELLYHHRSHGHWTPLSHRLVGEALAALILEKGLLGSS